MKLKDLFFLLIFPFLPAFLLGFWLYLQGNISGVLSCIVFSVLWLIYVSYAVLKELMTK